jgi:diguanylate cyclase (GGDEF)-like protein/PAS domain S-box-containing protein
VAAICAARDRRAASTDFRFPADVDRGAALKDTNCCAVEFSVLQGFNLSSMFGEAEFGAMSQSMPYTYPPAEPEPQVSPLSPASFLTRLSGGVVLLNLFVFTLVGLSILQSHRQYQDRAEITTQNLTQTLESEIAGAIEIIGVTLFAVKDEFEKQSTAGNVARQTMNPYIARVHSHFSYIDGLRIADERGRVVYGEDVTPDSQASLADRQHFIRQRDNPNAGLVISRPVRSRVNNKWVIVFTRRLNHSDGSFAGIVLASVTLHHLSKTFSELNVGPRGIVTLLDSELGIVVRHPEPQSIGSVIGQKVVSPSLQAMIQAGRKSGTYQTLSTVDGIERMFSYRRVGDSHLIVVGLATEDYLAEWRHESTRQAVLAALFGLITLSAAWLIYRIWKRQFNLVGALARQEAKFRTVADFTFDWEYWQGQNYEILYMTPSCERVTGYPPAEFVADPSLLLRIIHVEDRHAMDEHLHDITHQDGVLVDFRIVRRDGGIRWIAHHCRAISGQNGEPMGRRVSNRDITERKQAEVELRIAATAFESQESIVVTDADNVILRVNRAFTEITGYTPEEAVGRKTNLLNSGRHDAAFYTGMWERLRDTGSWQGEIWNRRKNGEVYPEWLTITAVKGVAGEVTHYVGTQTDITQRKAAEDEIKHLAFYDPLTRLPNRRMLLDRLNKAFAQAKRYRRSMALMFVDLDDFKKINDCLGHDVGDEVLKEVAARLKVCVRSGDTVSRQGGDEFVIVLTEIAQPQDAAAVAQKILEILIEPISVGEHRLNITTSIGITVYPENGTDLAGELMKKADMAMYSAKEKGKNQYHFCNC